MSWLLDTLGHDVGLSRDDLMRIILTAPRRYKVFQIPKRTGGVREIAQPSRELKVLQRVLIHQLLTGLPVHSAAKAYRSGLSIRNNAEPHVGNGPILKMDFENFFPSIRSEDWEAYCDRNGLLMDDHDRRLSSLILFRRAKGEGLLKLSIGAPSSPALSNALLFDFDTLVFDESNGKAINYTRYADDMTFSGQRIGMLKDMIDVVREASRKISRPHLTINRDKTTFVTAASRRYVTGVILTNQGELSLGRNRKRLISAKVHRATKGALDPESMSNLAGELAFANVVEPSFIDWLVNKYSAAVIKRIQRSVRVPQRTL